MKIGLTYDDVQIVPDYSNIASRSDVCLETFLGKDYTLALPVIGSPMSTICEKDMAKELSRLGCMGVIHRFQSIESQAAMLTGSPAAAAVGATGDYLERTQELLKNGVEVVLIDVAHGDHLNVIKAISSIKKLNDDILIIAGCVATGKAAVRLAAAGADLIRVGVGNGSLCETRIRAGVGVPQVSAILDVVDGLKKGRSNFNAKIIADGGIRYIGDIAKAFAAGAHFVMLGSMLSGTKETPGVFSKEGVFPNEKLYKKYSGQASYDAKQETGMKTNHVEGNSIRIAYKGKVKRIIKEIEEGIRSSLSYVGATNLDYFRLKSEFIRVTSNGTKEAFPHLLLE